MQDIQYYKANEVELTNQVNQVKLTNQVDQTNYIASKLKADLELLKILAVAILAGLTLPLWMGFIPFILLLADTETKEDTQVENYISKNFISS